MIFSNWDPGKKQATTTGIIRSNAGFRMEPARVSFLGGSDMSGTNIKMNATN